MKLDIGERFKLVEILPKEGDRLTAKVVRGMLDRLNVNSDEITKYNIRAIDSGNGRQQILWDSNEGIEFSFNAVELDILKKKVDELEKEKKISIDMVALFDKLGV